MKASETLDALKAIYAMKGSVSYPRAVYRGVNMLLKFNMEDFLDYFLRLCMKNNVKATFFVVGRIAEKNPKIVERLIEEGHEIASHSMNHLSSRGMSMEAFDKEVKDSIKVLEHFGIKVEGYRAPNLALDDACYKILKRNGIKYSSSKRVDKKPFAVLDDLYEVPVSFEDYSYLVQGRDKDAILKDMESKVKDNAVFLFHPYGLGSPNYKDVLERFFNKGGASFVTVRDMVKQKKGVAVTVDIGIK
jgi:peptidoglycan/xylan/chitin deacetylase (PgdA/CDA1 family)